MRPVVVALVAALAVGGNASAQKPAPPPQATPTPAPATGGAPKPPVALPSPPPNYVYAPEGRRDPFVSLLNRGADTRKPGGAQAVKRPEGLAGVATGELAVQGILLSRGTWIAMVSGPDKKVYTARAGDRLLDGVIRAVTADSVVILQEVKDPLSLEKQREVRKYLRGGEVK
jgi:Tfp pilus assembly protein PilP